MAESIAVTGAGVAVPGARTLADLLAPDGTEPVDPADRIGKKGLRYKDQATRLGLVAGYEALRDAGLTGDDAKAGVAETGVDPASVAVVVSSNLGNLDSVCSVVDTIAEHAGTRLISPIITPSLSSNVIASEVAIRYGLRGPNLTVCNGATSGLDAVRWAVTWLAAGRARYALVLGAEPDTDAARALHGGPVLDGAVGLLLERPSSAAERGAEVLALLDAPARAADLPGVLAGIGTDGAALHGWYADAGNADLPGVARFDLPGGWGDCSGALGLVQCAAAIARLRAGADGPILAVSGGPGADAVAGLLLRAAR